MKNTYLLLSLLFVASCNFVQYHPYELAEHTPQNLTEVNIRKIEKSCADVDTIRIAFISDTQRQYDLTLKAVDYINGLSNIDFIVHGGDITDFGLMDEFDWMTNLLCKLNQPFVSVIGNHDFLGVAEHNYNRIYGDYNWSFNAGHVHFVGLNTNCRELEYAIPVPDFGFLQKDIARVDSINHISPDSLTHTVFVMHARPGDDQFNNNVVIPFLHYIQRYPGTSDNSPKFAAHELADLNLDEDDRLVMTNSNKFSIALNGHNHRHEIARYLDHDLLFYGISDIKDREIYLFTFTPSGFQYESVTF